MFEDAIFDDVSTHYISMVCEDELSDVEDLPVDQHSEYRWFDQEGLMQSDEVHRHIKDCFTEEMDIAAQKRRVRWQNKK